MERREELQIPAGRGGQLGTSLIASTVPSTPLRLIIVRDGTELVPGKDTALVRAILPISRNILPLWNSEPDPIKGSSWRDQTRTVEVVGGPRDTEAGPCSSTSRRHPEKNSPSVTPTAAYPKAMRAGPESQLAVA